MSFRKPFKAVPIKPGPRHRAQQPDKATGVVPVLLVAALVGPVIGLGSLALTEDGRARKPQAGDYWPGCDAARAAGTAPIYVGEPGYREGMDGDGDGVACEPYRG